MSNFDTARDALNTSLESSGSAMAEHEKWSQSLEARLLKLKAAWQSFALTFMDSDFLKGSVDAIKGLVEALDWLVDNFGLLGSIGLGAGITSVFKYFKGAKEAKKTITDVANGIEHLTEVVQNGTVATNAATDANLESAASEMTEAEANTASVATETAEAEANLASATSETSEATANATSTASELAEAEANATSTASELAEAEANLASATSETSEATANAESAASELVEATSSAASAVAETAEAAADLGGAVATVGAGATKAASGFAAFATSTAGVVAGIGILVAVIGLAYNAYKNAKEAAAEARQEAIESSDAYLDAASSFEQAYIKYSGKTDLTATEEEDLKSAIQGTVDALGDKDSALQGIVNSSNDYLASLEAIKDAELDAAKTAAENKRDNAAKELKEAAIGWESWDGSEVNIDFGNIRFAGNTTKGGEAAKIAEEINSEYLNEFGYGDKKQARIELSGDADTTEIIEYYNYLLKFKDALKEAGYEETSYYDQVESAIGKMSDSIGLYVDGTYEFIKANRMLQKSIPTTVEEYIALREAVLTSDDVKNFSFDQKMSILNSLDSQYGKSFDLSSAEAQARKFVGIIEDYGDGTKDGTDEIGTVETFLNMRTAVNNNECSVGDYLDELSNVKSMSEKFSDEEKEQFNLTFGLDTDSIKEQYDSVYNYISRNYLNKLDTTGMTPIDARWYKEIETEKIQELLSGLTATELAAAANIKGEINWETTSSDEILKQIKEEAALIEAMNFTIAIDVEAEGIEALNTALAESKSATGLATESIDALKARYEDLDGYNAATLFEETANGIRVNSTELAKLEEEYKDFNKQEIDKTLETLVGEYNDLTDEINGCSDASKRADLYAQRDAVQDQINDVATLAAQFEGLTSAYNEWQSVQEAGQDRDMYESIISGREEIQDEMSRGWLDDATVEYLELLTGKELSTAGIDAQIAAYKKLDDTIGNSKYSIWDFFTEDEDGNATSDGVFNFFDAVKSVAGETAAWIDENGAYHFDFEGFEHNGKTGDAAIAEILGTSEELVQIMLKAAEDAGFVVNIKGEYTDLANLKDEAQVANDRMKELCATTYTFNFDSTDIDNLNEQIDEAETMLGNLKNKDGTLKVGVSEEDYRQAQDMIAALIYQKQSLDDSAILHVDTSQASSNIELAISKLQEFRTYTNTYELETAIGADTSEAITNIQSVLDYINGLDADIKAGLGLDTTEVQTAIDSVQANIKAGVAVKQEDLDVVNAAISSISNDAMVNLGLDTTLIDNYKSVDQTAKGTVNWDNNIEKVTAWINQTHEASGTVKWNNNTENVKTTFFGNGVINWSVSEANGTANANGTAFADGNSGRAFKHGDWGINGSGVALGGELGTEILVRDGKWFTIGDNGAEFFRYRQGDIIFNHRQAEELFANGKVTSGGGRGKALANGTAFAVGSHGSGFGRNAISSAISRVDVDGTKTEVKKKAKNNFTVTTETEIEPKGDNNGSVGDGGTKSWQDNLDLDKNGSSEKEFEETFDWVEIKISRLERAIDNLDKTANNVYKSWSDRNSALSKEIGKVGEEIKLQESAAQRYLQEANSVGLSSSYAEMVRNGTINIEDFKGEGDEALVEKIKDYQTWYEKYLACTDAAEELRETESKLFAQRFENIQTQYDAILQGYEHTEAMLNEYISQAEEHGYIVSKKYYEALIENEQSNINELKREQADLIAERDNAVAAGKIVKGSEAWYEQCAAIDEVTQAIEESTTALLEYDNAIRDIDWQIFDLIQERISDVAEEADFLIELMSNKKLFEDDGKLTSQGLATMALHGQNYNTHMYQADEYGDEVAKLDKQIEKDPYDQELINRRNELLELQRESILAAESEKNAIRDMVEDGINLELDALQELIDKKNEELESERDLYEYQKKVKEQTKEIASLEKQMSAYSGDDSEEARQKIQQIKVDLETARQDLQETEYDKFISDTSSLLDTLYTEYELILNTRLDNIDALLAQVIDSINAAASAEGVIATALGSEGALAIAVGNNAISIKDTLASEANKVGVTLSSAMNSIWDSGDGNVKSVLTMYGEDFKTKSDTIITTLNGIKTSVSAMVSSLTKEAEEKVEAPKTQPSSKANPVKNTNNGNKPVDNSKPSTDDGVPKVGDKVKFVSGQYYNDSQGDTPLGAMYRGKEVYITKINTKKWATHPYHISTGNKLGKGDLGWLKLNQLSGYAVGKQNFLDDEIAWTQENGREFIVRPSDGAILTPVAKGDSILTSAASGNIWSMANNPTEFIKDNLGIGSANVPNNSNVNNSVVQNFENITFSMPNVHGYNDLLTEMQRDPKFEKLILSMTINRIAGRSSLAKGKSVR